MSYFVLKCIFPSGITFLGNSFYQCCAGKITRRPIHSQLLKYILIPFLKLNKIGNTMQFSAVGPILDNWLWACFGKSCRQTTPSSSSQDWLLYVNILLGSIFFRWVLGSRGSLSVTYLGTPPQRDSHPTPIPTTPSFHPALTPNPFRVLCDQ